MTIDCLILGGGVIGLSIAYQLSHEGKRIRVIDRSRPGQEASWAGGGILPPANLQTAVHPLEKLRGLSHQLHPVWSEQLRAETGIDTGFRRCGGLYLARSPGEAASLHALAASLAEVEIEMNRITAAEVGEIEPALQPLADSGHLVAVYRLPDESQLRNPHHLQALVAACQQRGVEITDHVEATDFNINAGRINGVVTTTGTLSADQYCVTTGAWTFSLLSRLGIKTGILPIRGQIVLFRAPHRVFTHVLNEGPRYLVPRDDGRVIVGSTEEEVGFNRQTTAVEIQELTDLACRIVPDLSNACVEKTWAGLRPDTFDGFPYIGSVPDLPNAFVAAGHFRSGLHMSPGTALVICQLMRGETPEIDLSPFRVGRG
ncbi:MAG: glycine oxidase ThiO [Pirellulaceae bacterium]|jgi:glycine oxidase|nr:glycine oxidase ThiO [Planctomycetaceae bacterium]MDP6554390.1 glycine oxidase ThiO [Pirellulaceae bacterium]